MPYVIARSERFALHPGDNVLGGSGAGAVILPGLAGLPPAAVLALAPGAAPTIRRLAPPALAITVDGAPLRAAPLPLAHGSRVLVGRYEIVYGDMAAAGRTAHVVGLAVAAPGAAADSLAAANPTADTGGRLVALRTGRAYPVPERGLVLGRDPGCDVVLDARDVSRRHAMVRSSLFGYAVTGEGANGTFVNGQRVDGTVVLGQGDVLRVGPDEFRFEADVASYEPSPELLAAAASFAPEPAAAPVPPPPAAPPPAPELAGAPTAPAPLAMLEVVNEGPARGTRYPVERAVTQVGRAPQSDVRFTDGSVSGAHATLLLRRGAWYVVDLDATNGTYVNGERVVGERALTGGCTLRFGDVKVQFWSIAANADPAGSTRRMVGIANGRPVGSG